MESTSFPDHGTDRLLAPFIAVAPGMLYVFDVVTGRNVYVNDHVGQAIGYSPGEVAALGGDFLPRLLHEDDHEPLASHYARLHRLTEGEAAAFEYRIRHRDGTWRWFESRDTVYRRDPDGRVREIIGIATDITPRKEAEEALKAVADENRFRALLADRLRQVDDPAEAQSVAAELLGKHLGATRAHYADIVDDGRSAIVRSDYCDGVSSVVGHHRLDAYGRAVMEEFRSGHTVTMRDVRCDARLAGVEADATVDLDTRAYLMVPLMRAARPVAALIVHQAEPREWSASEVRLVEETAERTRATVEQAQGRAAAIERNARYRTLFESIDEGFCLGEMIVDDQGRPIDYRFLEVNARFEEQTGLVDPVGKTALELVPSLERHWIETYARVGLGGETLRFESDSESMGRWFDVYASPVQPAGCGQFVIVFRDASDRRRAEEALRQSEEAERRAHYRSQLVSHVIAELESLDSVALMAQRFVEALVPRLADYATLEIPASVEPVLAVAHHDPDRIPLLRTLRENHRLRPSEANSIARAAQGHAQMISRIAPESLRDYARDEETYSMLRELGPRSHIAVPVDVLGCKGALMLGLSDPKRHPYSDQELELAQEIAGRVSNLLTRARAREDEHSIAVRLQQALLPGALPRHPAIQVAARYQTGSSLLQVGGDWYDAFSLPDGRIALSVGDVVGHGLEAAAAMGRLRVALAALAPHADSPSELITRLDSFASGADGVDFATACYAELDPADGTLHYASAGHPPMLVVGESGETRWLEGGRSTPLGISSHAVRADAEDELRSGDLLIAFSDGLVERRGEPINEGLDRLERVARTLGAAPASEACHLLVERLVADPPEDDDIVVMCLRFSPVTAAAFQRVLPARPEELAPTRAALRTWLDERNTTARTREDLLIAVGEALGNAVEHAYNRGPAGTITMAIVEDEQGDLHVEIRDRGQWQDESEGADRGRGTGIMSALTRDFTRATDQSGTTVKFTFPVGSAVHV
jgi:PAS domain S-box-containing protein